MHISDSTAEDIRSEIEDIVNQSLSARITPGNFSKDIGIQVYYKADAPQKIYAHFINYDYELQQDQVNEQENISVEIRLPAGFNAQAVKVISPDFEGTEEIEFTITNEYITFTVPQLHIWDVVVIE